MLGKTGDNTCARSDNELLLGQNDVACLLLPKDTIKTNVAADSLGLMLARVRVVFLQPGPVIDTKTAGWVLYTTRTHCSTE
jgi:hypothetical protein